MVRYGGAVGIPWLFLSTLLYGTVVYDADFILLCILLSIILSTTVQWCGGTVVLSRWASLTVYIYSPRYY